MTKRKKKKIEKFNNWDSVHYILYRELEEIGISEPYLRATSMIDAIKKHFKSVSKKSK